MNNSTINLVCVSLWTLSLVLWLIYLGKPSRYRVFTPLGIFWLVFTVTVQWPSLYVFYNTGWSLDLRMIHFPLIIAVAPICVLAGACLVGRVSACDWEDWWRTQPLCAPNTMTIVQYISIFGIIVFTVHIIAVGGRVPLVLMFTHFGEYGYLGEAREESLKLLPLYLTYPIVWFQSFLMPWMAIAVVLWYIAYRCRLVLAMFIVMLTSFWTMFTSARSPVAILLLALIAAYYMATGRRVGPTKLAIAFVLILSFPVAVNTARHGQDINVRSIVETYEYMVMQRMLSTPSWIVGAHVQHVPHYSDGFLYGRSIAWYTRLTRQEHYRLSWEVMTQQRPGNVTGISNTTYVADAWANFAWPGVVLYSILVGALLCYLERLLISCNPTILIKGLAIIVSVKSISLCTSSLQVWLSTHSMLFAIVLLALYKVYCNKGKALA